MLTGLLPILRLDQGALRVVYGVVILAAVALAAPQVQAMLGRFRGRGTAGIANDDAMRTGAGRHARDHPAGGDIDDRHLVVRTLRRPLVGDVHRPAVGRRVHLDRIPADGDLADHATGRDVDDGHRVLVAQRHVEVASAISLIEASRSLPV